jgi:RNA polymerase sigma factor (sigma-70 family)
LAAVPGDVCSDESEEELAAMERELARLPVIEREVLTLFYLRELSLTEVADVLGVPIGTVKSRLLRARRQLRRELDSEGESA